VPSSRLGVFDVELVACRVVLGGSVSASSVQRVWPAIVRFARFAETTSTCRRLADIGPVDTERFLRSRTSTGSVPSAATVRNRLTALRLLFRAARQAGLITGDPTLDAVIAPTGARPARPLTDSEIAAGRDAALWSLTTRRYACAWALAETTARGSELAQICWTDINLATGAVVLPGGRRIVARTGQLSVWGRTILAGEHATVTDRSGSVLYTGSDVTVGGRVAASNALSTVLIRAGLASKPDIRPGSITGWAGRQCLTATGDIAAVARLLGMRSLDHAARLIGWDWTQP
jgi:integrase